MELIMDGLLVAAAVFAGTYCWVLSRRVQALKNLDSGLGGAITQLTRSLEDARRALEEAKAASRDGRHDLKDLITRAEAASGQLRILLAASKDLMPPDARPGPAAGGQPRGDRGGSAGAGHPEAAPAGEAGSQADTPPKPRPLTPLPPAPMPLRNAPAAPPARARSEAELLAALEAFAGEGRT